MPRYFKITEIDEAAFVEVTGEELDCCQLSVPVLGGVYVAVDEVEEYEITVPLEMFDVEG